MGVKSFKADSAKRSWRRRMREFIPRHIPEDERPDARVICLPGKEMREVFEVYDRLGFDRKNITGLEVVPAEYRELKEHNEALAARGETPITLPDRPMDATTFYETAPATPTRLHSHDYCGYYGPDKEKTLETLAGSDWLAGDVLFLMNYLMGREQDTAKDHLAIQLAFARAERQTREARKGYDPSTTFRKAMTTGKFDLESLSLMGARLDAELENVVDDLPMLEARDTVVQQSVPKILSSGEKYLQHLDRYMPMVPRSILPMLQQGVKGADIKGSDEIMQSAANMMANSPFGATDSWMLAASLSLALLDAKPYVQDDHEAYKYVSDTGMPMISDFYALHAIESDLPVASRQIMGRVRARAKRRQRPNRKQFQRLAEMNNILHGRVSESASSDPLERVLIRPVEGSVYDALHQGLPDEEIMDRFGITTRSLGAYKAHVARS